MEDILIGATDRTILVFIPDPASTTGAGKTGLAAADITVTYTRVETDNDVVHTDVTSSLNNLSALTDAHNDWGWKEVSSSLSKGLYRLDIADAVFASGAWYAIVQITITSGTAAATPKAFRLVARNDLDGVRLGLTALPNAAADAVGGLLVSNGVDVRRILDRVDFQRGHHTVAGSTFYVDGVGGNDANAGTRALPKKTISAALALCTSNAHDEIILLPNSGGGPTTITESATITVAKNYVQIRGPGRDVLVTLNTSGSVFDISAGGVQLSGMRIATFSGASSDGININSAADFVSISRCYIESAHRDGVQLNVANNCLVEDCQITSAVRDAVRISSGSGSGNHNKILRNILRGAGGTGVNLQGSDASNCRIQHNLIRDCATGITVASGVANSSITDNRFAGNTTNISDSGTSTQHDWNRLATNLITGAVDRVALVDTLTAYTGNTPQTGDSFAIVNSGSFGNAAIKTQTAAIEVDTQDIQSRLPSALVSGRMDSSVGAMAANTLTASAAASDFGEEIRSLITGGAYTLNTDANGRIRIVDGTGTGELDTLSGTVLLRSETQASIDAIEADTDELQTAWAPFTGVLNLGLWAIKAKTDGLNFTGSNVLALLADSVTHGGSSAMLRLGSSSSTPPLYITNSAGNVVRLQATGGNGTALKLDAEGTGHGLQATGGSSNGDGFNLGGNGSGAIGAGLAINPLSAAIDALPTNSELATALASADDATLAAIAALNNLSAAQVWAAGTRTLTALGFTLDSDDTDTTYINEIRDAITGYSGALNLDASGNVKISDGTGANQLSLTSGLIDGITGTINTLDQLDAAQDSQHTTTQGLISALNNLSAAQVWAAGTRTLTSGANIALAKGVGVTGFNDIAASDVLTQVETALATTTRSLPGQVTPSTTPTLAEAIMQLFQQATNPSAQDASTQRIYSRDGSVVHQKRTALDDNVTASLGALVTGP